jgi:hypothetical protein
MFLALITLIGDEKIKNQYLYVGKILHGKKIWWHHSKNIITLFDKIIFGDMF